MKRKRVKQHIFSGTSNRKRLRKINKDIIYVNNLNFFNPKIIRNEITC